MTKQAKQSIIKERGESMVNPRLYDSRKIAKKEHISHDKIVKVIEGLIQESPKYKGIYANRGDHYMMDNQGIVILKIRFNKYR